VARTESRAHRTASPASFAYHATIVLCLREVSKSFAGADAVRGVSLDVQPGKTTVLLGPSGCGKSTLLRLMLGLTIPDTGEILFDDEPLRADNLRSIRRRAGYVIQDGGLFPHLTSRQNITLMARLEGWSPARIDERLDTLTSLTKFPDDALDRYPIELSGGQRQRVALMRALFLDPDFLLLDEPLGALDPMIRAELQADLREIFRTLGKTVVLVTHDLDEAEYLGDHVVLVEHGAIAQQGSIQDLAANPADAFVAQFFSAQRRRPEDDA
jgi:osmoprotectant transport system ATP-binding protein